VRPKCKYIRLLDRCITLLVEHKLTTETASMIKYSTDMCGKVVDVCNYSEVMDICWIINFKNVCWQSYCPVYAGTNEIMKIVIARGLFKDLLRKGRNSKNNLVVYFLSTIGQDGSLSRKQCGVCLIYSSKYIYACWYDDCKSDFAGGFVFCWLIERSWKYKIFYCFMLFHLWDRLHYGYIVIRRYLLFLL
jgi:hypothetical protein